MFKPYQIFRMRGEFSPATYVTKDALKPPSGAQSRANYYLLKAIYRQLEICLSRNPMLVEHMHMTRANMQMNFLLLFPGLNIYRNY